MCLVLQMLIWAEDTGPGLPAAWESMKEEIQAKPRKPCAATGTKKEPPFPGIHTRALVSQGKVQLQGLWAHRTLGKEAPPGAGSPSPQLPASPRGTRTELVTFHPQHVTFMKHSRIQGKEGKSQVGTLSRLSRKPAHPRQHTPSRFHSFQSSLSVKFLPQVRCNKLLSYYARIPTQPPAFRSTGIFSMISFFFFSPWFLTWTFLYFLSGETAPMILTWLGILSLSG